MTLKVELLIQEILKQYVENKNNLIFWDFKDNSYIKRYEINLYLNRISKKYNITNTSLSSHRLRHTFITRCFESGMNLKIIQAIVGHIDGSSITVDVYVSTEFDFIFQELEKLNNK